MQHHPLSRNRGFSAGLHRGIERLRHALRTLQGWLAVDRPTQALVWIPIRDLPPSVDRAARRRHWRD